MFYLNKYFEYLNEVRVHLFSFIDGRQLILLLIVYHQSSPYCLCRETNESSFLFVHSITLRRQQVRQSRCHANGSHILNAHLAKQGMCDLLAQTPYKHQHSIELYIRKVLENWNRQVTYRHSLRRACFAVKYRFLTVDILHFRSFIPC